MKTRLLASLLSVAITSWAGAAEARPGGPVGSYRSAPATLAQGQVEILLAPIALYPDALVALILPAATRPSDIVLASRFLKAGGKKEDIEIQAWDDSVKALARFPEVIHFMDENLAWTQEVGDAFVAQPVEVMGAIQTLRARATRNGALASTAEQEVIFEDNVIRIVPAKPTVIYVPYYDPWILHYEQSYAYYPRSVVWFGIGYGIGSWLSYDCDWGRRTVWVHHHHHYWNPSHDWRRRYTPGWSSHIGGTDWRRWEPSPSHRRHRPRTDNDFARHDPRPASPPTVVQTNPDRSRFEHHLAERDHESHDVVQTNPDRSRFELRRDLPSNTWPESRSVSRPETFHNPPEPDQDQTPLTTDYQTSDYRGNWRSSDSLTRLSGPLPIQSPAPSYVPEPSQTDVVTPPPERRAVTPTRTLLASRAEAIDRRSEVASSGSQHRETRPPAASPPTVSHHQVPSVTRSVPEVRPAPAVTSSRSIPAPSRPAPVEESHSENSRGSTSPDHGESRRGPVQTEEP